jgi:hypothetical protein
MALAGVVLAGCGDSRAELPRQPVPTFAPDAAAGTAPPAPRTTLLPTDCQDVSSGAEMSALLGKPVDSVQSHTVVGIGAASVGRLERVSCQYRPAGVRTGPPALELNLAAYATAAAADHQLTTNATVERAAAERGEDFAIGSARAVLCTEGGKSVLLVASGRVTVTMTLHDGVVDPDQTRSIMVDLTQRVLPRLGPVVSGSAR